MHINVYVYEYAYTCMDAHTHIHTHTVSLCLHMYLYIYIERERERERERAVCVPVSIYIRQYGCMHTHNLQGYCTLLTALSGRDSFNNRSPRTSLQYLASLYCCPLQQWFSNERMTGKSEVTKAVSRRA
jgi:hypothetical protein